MRKYSVAIVGATGAVGGVMREILQQRDFPIADLFLLASKRSAGKTVKYQNQNLTISDLADFDFAQVDLALFSAGAAVSAEHAMRATKSGCVVIDNTSHFRYEKNIPLVVPEVNAAEIAKFKSRGIIANPNCTTIQMVVALKPIMDAVGIKRINVASYNAVSGAGASALRELNQQSREVMQDKTVSKNIVFPATIAFNAIPQIDYIMDNGYTKEEMKIIWETRKIMGDESLKVNPTCVRIPVINGHSMALHIETTSQLSVKRARELISNGEGVVVTADDNYPTAVTHADGKDEVYVGRIRKDLSHKNGLNMWVVADNLRKGAALNSVQIAEKLIANYL